MRPALVEKTKDSIFTLLVLFETCKKVDEKNQCQNLIAKYCRILYITAPEGFTENDLD
jgi:hypothetical protein